MKKYIIQSVSKDELEREWKVNATPQIFVANTKHYSWPKGAAIAGIGSDNVVDVKVDHDGRLDIRHLTELLQKKLDNRQAVYMVVAIVGSTEEGAVDPVEDVVKLRNYFEARGLFFVVHADAAWGGYYASMIKEQRTGQQRGPADDYVPHVGLRPNTEAQLRALTNVDAITIDPHKAGYIPYPAGGLCYRDGRMRYLLTWTAPYLHQGATGESIGVYGVEGSKPGASAGAVWLAHDVIGLHKNGYGVLLGEAAFNCRRFASHWSAMSTDKTDYIVVPFNLLPSERHPNCTPADIEKEKQFIRERILSKDNVALVKDGAAMSLLNELGSDLNINAFACNFRDSEGNINTDVEEANHLNKRIFERMSVTDPKEDPSSIPFYITSTTFAQKDYQDCATFFKNRLGLKGDQDLFVLRNVVMSPFGTTSNFVQKLADIFKGVLKEEVEAVRTRNVPKAGVHTFLMQGTDKVHFVHLPSFHKAGGRYQLIFSANLSDKGLKEYISTKASKPSATFVVRNETPDVLDNLLSGTAFKVSIFQLGGSVLSKNVELSNIHIVKKRSLITKDLNASYPESMPFYLYGTADQQHIDHALLLAPNIQLTAACVQLSPSGGVSPEDLQNGVIACAENVHENSMQPFPATAELPKGDKFFFSPKKQLQVAIYKDSYPAITEGRIDLESLKHKIGTATITIGSDIYVDSNKLNDKNSHDPVPFRFHSSGRMKSNAKQHWVEHLSSRLA